MSKSISGITHERHNSVINEFITFLIGRGRTSHFLKANICYYLAMNFTTANSNGPFLEAKTAIMTTLEMALISINKGMPMAGLVIGQPNWFFSFT